MYRAGKLGKRHVLCARTLYTATRGSTMLHRASASFQTSWLAEVLSVSCRRCFIIAACGLRHTTVSMNELNSHCSDAVTTMDTVHPLVPRALLLVTLASYRLNLRASTGSIFLLSSYPVHSSFLLLAHFFADSACFPAFLTSLHFVHREPWNWRFDDYKCRRLGASCRT